MEEHRNKDCVVRKKEEKNEFYSVAMKAKKQRKKKNLILRSWKKL